VLEAIYAAYSTGWTEIGEDGTTVKGVSVVPKPFTAPHPPLFQAFGASPPENWLGLAGAVALGALAFAGLGVGAAALIRSAEGVSAVVNVIVLPMAFLSGSFGPTDLPKFLQAVADVLPLTYYLDLVNSVYLDGESLFADPGALGVVVAWGVGGLVVALWKFGWMPRER